MKMFFLLTLALLSTKVATDIYFCQARSQIDQHSLMKEVTCRQPCTSSLLFQVEIDLCRNEIGDQKRLA